MSFASFKAKTLELFFSTLTLISPRLNTKARYRYHFGKPLDLKDPKTLNEKLLWLKLNRYRKDPLVIQCADKVGARDYVRSCGCEEILTKEYGVFSRVEEIPWERLPSAFALKWSFDAGKNIICADKEKLDIPTAIAKLKKWGKTKDYLKYSEMQYHYSPKRILCEEYLKPQNGTLPEDYKFYCFHGEPHCVMLCVGREKGHPSFYFFDREWNLLRINKAGKAAPADFSIPKPKGINEAFEYAKKLSQPFPFVRADFYLLDGKVYFGELTFTPSGAMDTNRLPETDLMFGEKIDLQSDHKGIQS